jgi:hypothetical protein
MLHGASGYRYRTDRFEGQRASRLTAKARVLKRHLRRPRPQAERRRARLDNLHLQPGLQPQSMQVGQRGLSDRAINQHIQVILSQLHLAENLVIFNSGSVSDMDCMM